MYVRKVRGQDKVGKVIMFRDEVELAKKLGIPLEAYIKQRLIQIAKERRWHWYLNKGKA